MYYFCSLVWLWSFIYGIRSSMEIPSVSALILGELCHIC